MAAHWGAISGADFFTVEVLTWKGLIRYHVFFAIDLATRRVKIGGLVREPDGKWMKTVIRGMLDAVDGALLGTKYLILDRDPVFTKDVYALLASGDVTGVVYHREVQT